MEAVIAAARLLLAAVFLLASLGKALDPKGSRRALLELGAPPRLVPAAVLGLPVAEAAAGVALLVAPVARAGAVAAAVLLATFALAMVRTLRAGRAPECHCFGALASERVGASGVARNLVLLALAVAVAGRADQPAIALPLAAVAVAVVLAAGLLLRGTGTGIVAASARAVEPLPVGAPAPPVYVEDAAGRSVPLESLLPEGGSCALAFVEPSCPPCAELLPALARWQMALDSELPIRVVTGGPQEAARELAGRHALRGIVVRADRRTTERLGLRGTPSALILRADGTVGSEPAAGIPAIEALIRTSLRTAGGQGQAATGATRAASQAAMNARP